MSDLEENYVALLHGGEISAGLHSRNLISGILCFNKIMVA